MNIKKQNTVDQEKKTNVEDLNPNGYSLSPEIMPKTKAKKLMAKSVEKI